MPGHLFVVHSDLTKIACDAVLIPSGSHPLDPTRFGHVHDVWISGFRRNAVRPPGIKNNAGGVYYSSGGLEARKAQGGLSVGEYVRSYVHKHPRDGYPKLEEADSLDLACEALVADETKPYAHLFSDEDRPVARERLAPHQAAIDMRKAEKRERVERARQQMRANGIPRRSELDDALRSRRHGN